MQYWLFTCSLGGHEEGVALTPAGTTHVYLDDRGVAWIDDTNGKVIEVGVDRVAWQWSPEVTPFQPSHLSLAQIYIPLFDPRTQVQDDHFRWSEDGAQIVGITPTERATVAQLQLNYPLAVTVRKNWVEAGWHPPTSTSS
jgi:hypothetical protein